MRKMTPGIILAMLLMLTLAPNTYAQDVANSVTITLDQAVDMALKNSKSLKKAEYDIERGQEVRDSIADDVKYIPSGQTDASVAAAYTGLLAADMKVQMAKKTLEVEKDKLVLSVFNKYTAVLAAVKDLELAEIKYEKAKKDFQIAQIGYTIGTVSQSQLKLAESQKKNSELNYSSAQKELEKAYESFNSVVGLNLDKRPILVDDIEFKPVEIVDLTNEVARIIDGSPAIWLAQQQVDLYEVALRLHNWADPTSDPYEAKQIDVDKAKVTAADTKEQLRNGLYNLYKELMQLQDQYEMAVQAVSMTQEDFRVKELQYQLGMLSQQEYLAAQLALTEAETNLNKITYAYEYLKQAFYKPWAITAATN